MDLKADERGTNSCAWHKFMVEHPERWRQLVHELHFADSSLDECAAGHVRSDMFVCVDCPRPFPRFASSKALDQHRRIKHGDRNPMRRYAGTDGVCVACGTRFGTRIRLISHLTDSRRPKCREQLLLAAPPFSLEDTLEMDKHDQALKRAAWREGHSHVIAVGSAVRADGRFVGRVQR